jgi:hypothetical protein
VVSPLTQRWGEEVHCWCEWVEVAVAVVVASSYHLLLHQLLLLL